MTKSRIMKLSVILFLGLIISGATYSYFNGGMFATLLDSEVSAEQKTDYLVDYFNSFGAWAPIAYVFIIMTEVIIAPIPAWIFYAPSGIVFGPFFGSILSVLGNTLGAGIACQISKQLGKDFAEKRLTGEKFEKWITELEKREFWLIVFLRMNPLTSSDIVSYAAGLTRIPTWKVMVATMIGLTPTCFVQNYFSARLIKMFPWLIYILIPIIIIFLVVAFIFVMKIVHPPAEANQDSNSEQDPDLELDSAEQIESKNPSQSPS